MTHSGLRGPARRLHLFEFEDLGWFPRLFRDSLTRWLAEIAPYAYPPVVPLVVRLLERAGTDRVVDLCSGGSGPWVALKPEIDTIRAANGDGSISLLLTDLFPNVSSLTEAAGRLGPAVEVRHGAVDARDVPVDLKGVRTLFTSFHHLDVPDARAVLADAARAGQAIGVFDMTERSWVTILGVLRDAPLGMWQSVRTWRPRNRAQLFLTYVVPLIVLTSTWDALVSQLRAYRPEELASMTRGLGGTTYHWETGVASSEDGESRITYVIGYPVGG